MSNKSKKYVIIDTDGGVDDAVALMIAAHSHQNGLINLLAITCCYGNTLIDNVVKNVCHALKVCGIEKVPVYKGCATPIIEKHVTASFHGDDGLGNSTKDMLPIDVMSEDEHAVNALIRLAKEMPKQITIMALGPLTNLAVAHLMDPQFFDNIDQIVVLGGTVTALGNFKPTAEFNFQADPEAAHVVLSNCESPITIIPWETCIQHLIPWDIYDQLIKVNTEKAKFYERIHRRIYSMMHDDSYAGTRRQMLICDGLVVIAFAYPQFITESNQYSAQIELNGLLTRGQLVVDRRQRADKKSERTIKFITRFNQSKLLDLMIKIIQ